MIPVSLWLITAHLVGDFPLQPDWIAQTKTENYSRLTIHALIHGILSIPIAWYIFPGEVIRQFVLLSWIVVTHWVIDHRRWVEPKEGWGKKWVWINDQIMHLVALSLAIPITELGIWG